MKITAYPGAFNKIEFGYFVAFVSEKKNYPAYLEKLLPIVYRYVLLNNLYYFFSGLQF